LLHKHRCFIGTYTLCASIVFHSIIARL